MCFYSIPHCHSFTFIWLKTSNFKSSLPFNRDIKQTKITLWTARSWLMSSFCFLSCVHAFPVTVSVGFLSAFVSFCWSRLFFSYLVFPPAAFTFCQVSAFRLQVFFLSGGFVFPSGFAFWNEAKTKAKTKAKFTTSSLAWTWPGAGKPSSPSCYYCDNYHCHCGA